MDWRAVIVALLMLVVFAGVAWWIRRFAGPVRLGGAQHVQIVGARRLDLNTTLYLVEVEGRRLFVGAPPDR
jgi:flagellar biogenesis protein FliO